jgi:large conductance mechanosensitive channel
LVSGPSGEATAWSIIRLPGPERCGHRLRELRTPDLLLASSKGAGLFSTADAAAASVQPRKRNDNMSMVKEFKDFAMKGNVVDMAVGIIIGAAFGKIVSSFVGDLIMPSLGLLIGGVDFTDLVITLKQASEGVEAVTLNYGKFIQTVFDFTIVAFAIFMAIKGMNKMKKAEEAAPPPAPPAPSAEQVLLAEIRDLLKERA